MPKQDLYATLSVPGTKKVSVCFKRVGSRDRLSVIATCNDETTAEKIVDALNALQGKLDQLSLPIVAQLEDVKKSLRAQTELNQKMSDERNTLRREKTNAEDLYRQKCDEAARLTRELALAQKAARENETVARNVSRANTAALMKG